MDSSFSRILPQAIVVCAFGGGGLVLTQLYSRRGPLIYPVCAAILFVLALSLSRATSLGFIPRFFAAFGGMAVSTAIAMAGTVVLAERARQSRARALARNRVRPRGRYDGT
jgi:drug/metabolite transporter superfamily protein YnfA